MTITRREWLKRTSVASAAAMVPLTGCDAEDNSEPVDALTFAHGVASGDPLTDRVIVWTRVDHQGADATLEVEYEVASDRKFNSIVTSGTVSTDASKDYTVKVDVTGLSAGRTYYYRFAYQGAYSAVGRTKTLPTGSVSHLRFAMCSCSNYAYGYFHAYQRIADRDDLDGVIHLGDYIYEYGNGGDYPPPFAQIRQWAPNGEIVSLSDYRTRYKLYRSDPGLQAAHARHAWMNTWDDHEITNDTWEDGAQNHMPATEGDFVARKAAATQAMYEYLPIRGNPGDPTYRTFRYGDLAEIIFLDTRHEGRDEQITSQDLDTDARHMISAEQEAWLSTTLQASTSQWKLLAQQVMVAPFSLNAETHAPFFLDQWDGYPAARQRLYDIIENDGGADVVVLTGDIHGSFAAELPRDPWGSAYDPATGAGSLAVEFVCPGITSPGFPGGIFDGEIINACPHMKYVDWTFNGYTVLDIRPTKIQADWYFIDSITSETAGVETFGAAFVAYTGDSHLVQVTTPER